MTGNRLERLRSIAGQRYAPVAVLAVITVLGFAFRLYRLQEQSIWTDEYLTWYSLNAPDVSTRLWASQLTVPEQTQGALYYIVQFYWSRLFGISLPALRWLSILCGMTAVPLIYLLGRHMYGPLAGLVAAACIAASPQHVWFSQEIRAYSLLTPLVIVSMYALLRAIREDSRKWWAVNLVTNALLPWTHILSVFFLSAEGCFLLFYFRRRFRCVVWWTALQLLCLMPWTVCMLAMPYASNAITIDRLTFGTVVKHLGANDIVSYYDDLLPEWKTNPVESLSKTQQILLTARPWCDAALIGVICAAVAMMALDAGRFRRRVTRQTCDPSVSMRRSEHAWLLLCVFLLPGLQLASLEWLIKHLFMNPMYLMYNSAALYLALGGLAVRFGPRLLKGVCVALIISLYVYQASIFIPEVTRTDWRSAARYIKENASPDDLVIEVVYHPTAGYNITYYLRDKNPRFESVSTFQAACEDSATFLSRSQEAGRDNQLDRNVWLIYERLFLHVLAPGAAYDATIQQGLADRNLTFEYKEFPGQYNLGLYRIRRDPARPPRLTDDVVPPLAPVDYDGALRDLGLAFDTKAKYRDAIAGLRRGVPFWPSALPIMYARFGLYLLEENRLDLAEALIRKSLQDAPNSLLGNMGLGLVLAAKNRDDEAMAAFQRIFQLQRCLREILGPFTEALCVRKDVSAAREEVRKIEGDIPLFASHILGTWRIRAGLLPNRPPIWEDGR